MMEYKYYRELKHNYLIVKKEGNESGKDRYRYRIAESGRIKGLLPCSLRSINGESYYYYEIGSMQTLRDRFASARMNYEQLKGLLKDLKSLLLELSEFLLGQEGLIFNVGSIYTDLTGGSYKFMYCPFYDEEKSFSSFAMELLSLVDEQDEKATELIYRLCEDSASREDFVYELLEECLEGDDKEQAAEMPAPAVMEPDNLIPEEDEAMPVVEKDSRMKRAGKRLSGKVQLLFSLMFALLLGAMVYIRKNYYLSSEENMLSILVMIISAITGIVAVVGGFREIKAARADSGKAVAAPKENEEEPAGMGRDIYEDIPEEFEAKTEDFPVRYPSSKRPIRITGQKLPQGPGFGETMVLDEVRTGGITLFSRNLDKTVRISLESLPLTVGKMEGCVDSALSDDSVSRIHCRFEEEDAGRISVRDLGSTNGTYKNGLKLKPQEKVFIDEGDEIRIGRVCFDCR